MNQVILAIGALATVGLLSLSLRTGLHQHEQTGMQADIELAAADLSVRALNRLDALPVESVIVPSTLVLDSLRSVEQADGLAQQVDIRLNASVETFELTVDVEPVLKQGPRFVATSAATPFRLATARVRGPLDVDVSLQRLYASGKPLTP